MNRMPKLVASRSLQDVGAWSNSSLIGDDLVEEVRRSDRDLVVVGSASVARTLIEHDLVDEYRLLVFPLVLGAGRRLFDGRAVDLELVATERVGAAVLLVHRR
jgi:dihydrofolate reductase